MAPRYQPLLKRDEWLPRISSPISHSGSRSMPPQRKVIVPSVATTSELDDQLVPPAAGIIADHRASATSTAPAMREHLEALSPELQARAERAGLCDPSDSPSM